jgi:hypothetical protein
MTSILVKRLSDFFRPKCQNNFFWGRLEPFLAKCPWKFMAHAIAPLTVAGWFPEASMEMSRGFSLNSRFRVGGCGGIYGDFILGSFVWLGERHWQLG